MRLILGQSPISAINTDIRCNILTENNLAGIWYIDNIPILQFNVLTQVMLLHKGIQIDFPIIQHAINLPYQLNMLGTALVVHAAGTGYCSIDIHAIHPHVLHTRGIDIAHYIYLAWSVAFHVHIQLRQLKIFT